MTTAHSHRSHRASEAADPAGVRLTAIAVLLGLVAVTVGVGLTKRSV